MAAVKTNKKKSGVRKEPVWTLRPCDACGKPVDALKNAWRVKRITFTPARRQAWCWYHRACL